MNTSYKFALVLGLGVVERRQNLRANGSNIG